jgi:hypothetical protein
MNPDSLYEALRAGGYEASLVTTYSIYFPFYEEIVLTRLRASGCRHNVVLVDARQCTQSMADPRAGPRRAGSDYTLVPVQGPSAFHPKILLLAGRNKAALYVGSHNLTLAGFGYNRELTSFVTFDPRRDAGAAASARSAWRLVKTRIEQGRVHLPTAVVDAVLAVARHAPWLEGNDVTSPSPVLLAQRPGGPPLIDQLMLYVPTHVRRIVVLGAFFDQKLMFLTTLRERWPQAKIFIGVDPESVSLPGPELAKSGIPVRNVKTLGEESGYLHAKAVYFEGRGDDDSLVCGSANPSAPAWLGGSRGNDEAVIVTRGLAAVRAGKSTGLTQIPEFPVLTSEQVRMIVRQQDPEDMGRSVQATVVACETDSGFELCKGAVSNPVSCVALSGSGAVKDLSSGLRETQEYLLVAADSETKTNAIRLLFQLGSGKSVEAVVHHSQRIHELARSAQQVQLRAALQGLTSDSTDLHRLIVVMEKVIFEGESAVASDVAANVAEAGSSAGGNSARTSIKPDSLAITAKETRSAKRLHARLLRGSDLGYLLDVLIHRLGIGLESEDGNLDAHGRTEEESVGQDDEEPTVSDPMHENVDDAALAQLCRSKVRRLVGRMRRQLQQKRSESGSTTVWLVQLLAVLAVLRELRTVEKGRRWKGVREGLLDREDEVELLHAVMRCFFGRGYLVYSSVVSTLGNESFDELARLKGLLIWLAWDCGVVLDERLGVSESREEVEERIWDRAALLELAQMLTGDEVSSIEARESVLKVVAPSRHQAAVEWLQIFERWSGIVESAMRAMKEGRNAAAPDRIGELAFASATKTPKLQVVVSAGESTVGLFDFGPESMEIGYQRGFVSTPML